MDALFQVWLAFLLVAYNTLPPSICQIIAVRLVNGPSRYEGTVEYTTDNVTWQTTCGTNFNFVDARLVCEYIGAYGTNRAIANSSFGSNLTQPTDGLNCLTNDTDISDCELLTTFSCSDIGAAICYDEIFLGCFNDSTHVLAGDRLIGDSNMTIDKCITHCRESTMADYVYAGVENGQECYCGVAGTNYSRLGAAVGGDGDCQIQCAGDAHSSCGGIGNIAVFQIPEVSQPVTSTKTTKVATEEAETSSVLPSNTIMVELTTTDDTPLPSNTPAVTRQAENTRKLDLTSKEHETGSTTPDDTPLSTTPTVTRPVRNTSILFAAGAGGGVVAIVIILVVIIVAVVLYKRRHGRAARKGPLPDQPSDKFDANNYHDYDEILMDSTLGNGEPSSRHRYEDSIKCGMVNKEQQLNMGYAKDEEDLGALYAVSSNHRPKRERANLGDLYAMPDKLKKSHVMSNSALKAMEPSTQECKPPVTDALYAMPDKRKKATDDDEEDGTEMVENPIYT